MVHIVKHLKLFALLGCLFSVTALRAASSNELLQLEAKMLQYMSSDERETFFEITEQLKSASKEEGDDKMFHKAWSNQAIYEATHQSYESAIKIAREMQAHAQREGCIYGQYSALHTEGMVLMQQQDYEKAEQKFLEAVDFHHRRFPNESAAEDLRELMKIAYICKDMELAKKYAKQLLAEPNLAPHHKGRVLYRLSIMAFDENNVEDFNYVYNEMKRLRQTDGILVTNLYTDVNHLIINGDYKQALMMVDQLAPDTCAERKALIYHRLGDNEKAYEYMVLYKHISDSLLSESHNMTLGSLYLRMNNDRLRLEQQVLVNKNGQLRYRFYITVAVTLILVLLFMIYKRRKFIRLLKQDNSVLSSGKEGAERALKDLNELSLYESRDDLSLNMPVNVNKLCDHLATITQNHCDKNVIVLYQTEFDDDYEIRSNADALERLLTHLLNNSMSFTRKGIIRLTCEDAGNDVKFSITDTSHSLDTDNKKKMTGLFAEEDDDLRHVAMNFSICQSICRLLQGRLWHDVDYTDGTRFCFEIPKEFRGGAKLD